MDGSMTGWTGGRTMVDVTVVLMGDGLSSTAILPVEIFHAAGGLFNTVTGGTPAPAFNVRTVTIDGRPVRSPYGIEYTPEGSIDDVKRTDIIIVPTPGLDFEPKLVSGSAMLPWLRKHYAQGAYIVGVCMGAAFVAEAGLLDGRMATTHWAICPAFAERWPLVQWDSDQFVTEDQRVLCSGGVCGSIDVSLYLVEKICGHEVALQTAKVLLLPMPRLNQSGYAVLPVSRPHDDDRIRDVEGHLKANFARDTSTAQLADRVGLGEKTFARRFKAATGRAPAAYIQALRIEAAKAMLERESTPVQQVSLSVGYEDVAFFRTLFKRATGMTPAEFRAHFAPLSVRGWRSDTAPVAA